MSNWVEDENKTRDVLIIAGMVFCITMLALINTGVIL
jgi:hypothetical protein